MAFGRVLALSRTLTMKSLTASEWLGLGTGLLPRERLRGVDPGEGWWPPPVCPISPTFTSDLVLGSMMGMRLDLLGGCWGGRGKRA